MQISLTFDSSVSQAPAGFRASINSTAQYYQTLFTNNFTLRIGVGWGEVAGTPLDAGSLGQSQFGTGGEDWAAVRTALINAHAPGASNIPQTPLASQIQLSQAQDRMLGTLTGVNGTDGYIGFNSTSFSFNPLQSGALGANQYDFVGVVEHELSEVMGRASSIDPGTTTGASTTLAVMDLYRYSAAGQRQLNSGDPSYFSLDGGKTNLGSWNNPVTGDPQGDVGDWGASVANDSYDADGAPGSWTPVSSLDITLMQALGYTTSSAANAASVAASIPTLTAANAVSTVNAGTNLYVNVADMAANIAANLDGLQTLVTNANIGSIALTDSGTPTLTLTPTQLTNDTSVLNDISSAFTVAITATAANVTVAGLAGHANIAVFSGAASGYTIAGTGNGTSFTVTSSGSTDHFSNVQALQFSDHTVIVAATPGTNSVTTGNVTELYGAVFGREPDVAGLAFYQSYATSNPSTPLLQFASWFLASPEYANNTAHNYAQTTTGETNFITDSYNNLLGRQPASGDAAYYETNVINPALAGLTPGTTAYATADAAAHAQVLVYFSASAEFLGDVQVTAANPASASHWLALI